MNWSYLVIRNSKIVKNGEWPWPFTKMQKFDSANGQFQKLAIRLFWPFVSPDQLEPDAFKQLKSDVTNRSHHHSSASYCDHQVLNSLLEFLENLENNFSEMKKQFF